MTSKIVTSGGTITDTISGPYNVIAGGDSNKIFGAYSAIGGGHHNTIAPVVLCATIPGGDSLTAQSFAQTVVGFNNIPAGGFKQGSKNDFAHNPAHADDPLFIAGNGNDGTHQSDAMIVSYDGHIVVTDNNGSTSALGGGRSPIYGGTYQDNTIFAWGDVPASVGVYNVKIRPNADIGVSSDPVLGLIDHNKKGVYLIHLSLIDAVTRNPVTLTNATITVTVNDDVDTSGIGNYGYATASHIGFGAGGAMTFIVHTFGDPTGSCCDAADKPFFFKICGR
jgi:hypothetical protein